MTSPTEAEPAPLKNIQAVSYYLFTTRRASCELAQAYFSHHDIPFLMQPKKLRIIVTWP